MINRIKFISLRLALGLPLLLSGCVSLIPPTPHSQKHFKQIPGPIRQAHLAEISHWSTSGAFSIQKTGEKPVLANYYWLQESRNHYRIRIESALNLFSIHILGTLNSVTLWKSITKHVTARTPEALLHREMGWSLPIRNLYYWTRGMAAPGQKQERFDQYGHLVALTQQGWKIQFSHYSFVKGYDLPEKLVLLHPDLHVTIVIKRWNLIHVDLPLT